MSANVSKITAVLVVAAVEPSLEFWEKAVGFTRVAEVPHGDALGFAMLANDGAEVMLQSEGSVRDDMKVAAGTPVTGTSTALFIEVSDLDAIQQAVAGYEVVVPRRTTFYGMHELGVREPGGHLVLFAQKTGE
jgi:uncharacterized glyoxalase superfamily protein PhnB